MKLQLDHIQLAIPKGSEDACRAFWAGILGAQELEKPKPLQSRGGVWFRIGQLEIHLGVEADFSPAKKAHPAFRVSEIDKLASQLDIVNWDHTIPGRRRFFTQDPVGNRIEFIQGIL